jgi:DNA-binding SARP family transcriptional activator
MSNQSPSILCSANQNSRRFNLLGPFHFRYGNQRVSINGKGRVILASLLLNANQSVSSLELMQAIWGDTEDSRRAALHTLMSRLRHSLAGYAAVHSTDDGYQIDLAGGELDVDDFSAALTRADVAAQQGDMPAEYRYLSSALSLWRGAALSDVPSRKLHEEQAARLDEERQWALIERIDLDLAAGRHAEIIGELVEANARYPLREGFARQLMIALYQCGRRAEALQIYRNLRSMLVEKVGIEPGPEIADLHHAMLTDRKRFTVSSHFHRGPAHRDDAARRPR